MERNAVLIRNKGPFNLGIMLAISFVGILCVIFAPIFGDGKTGLQYSDDLFNKLAKGSSHFIQEMSKESQKFAGKPVSFTVKLEDQTQIDKAVAILIPAGAQVGAKELSLTVSADLGKLLDQVLQDSDAIYNNNPKQLSERYPGIDGKEVLPLWWTILNKSIKVLQKDKHIEEAGIISDVMKKGIEPAHNFYGIEAQSVLDKAFTLTALLVFYVLYTMWWGYAIFYLFEGLGLTMKKAKVKKGV